MLFIKGFTIGDILHIFLCCWLIIYLLFDLYVDGGWNNIEKKLWEIKSTIGEINMNYILKGSSDKLMSVPYGIKYVYCTVLFTSCRS